MEISTFIANLVSMYEIRVLPFRVFVLCLSGIASHQQYRSTH
jgi:hypothetical protein